MSFKRNIQANLCQVQTRSLISSPKAVRGLKEGALVSKQFELVKVAGDSEFFREVNSRFQGLYMFYIDGASFIDKDPNWNYYVCFLDHKVVGFTSVLEDCKQDGQKKVLLSQFIVLPLY